ncbi:hypothetical protein G7054_g7182 [Neopestalotiopsis clavispora]|nr:hypothetical protein G7054_g7182 [Neopestalotiopsis clavispora]
MEVHLANLPADISDYQLKKFLGEMISALRIEDWTCQKAPRKNFGTLSFLRPADGEVFLRQHGELATTLLDRQGRPRMKARLVIMNKNVYCRRSFREVDIFMLRSLQKDAKERCDIEAMPEAQKHPDDAYSVSGLKCGYLDYNRQQKLVFSPEKIWRTPSGIAKFSKDELLISYPLTSNPRAKIRIEIPYRTIESILPSTAPTALTLTLLEPPRFFEVTKPDLVDTFAAMFINKGANSFRPTRRRLTEIPDAIEDHSVSKHGMLVGQCLVYQLLVSPHEFRQKLQRLRQSEILPVYSSVYNFPEDLTPNMSFNDQMRLFNHAIQNFVTLVKFEILFQVQALVMNGYILPLTGAELLQKLHKHSEDVRTVQDQRYAISGLAIKGLFAQIPFPGPDVDPSWFKADELLTQLEENESEIRLGLTKELISEKARNNLTMVYKVRVTPTHISLHGPEPEAKNRILRKFEKNIDRFIRFQFSDEDGQDVRFNSKYSNEAVYDRFLQVLNSGTQIGGRKYDFLGFSHSSLRGQSAWFMATFYQDEKLQTYFNVINDLGQFSDIYSPARCAARIGQAFSETPFAISLEDHGIVHYVIDDIRSGKGPGGRVFTDGVGWASAKVVDAILSALPQRKEATCFQIRWGGAKGMLALDTRQVGNAFAVRPSMVKFQSKDIGNLEICDMANQPIPLVLNRQMIKILEDMAVPNEWFFMQQDKELERLRMITATAFNVSAFLKRKKIADQLGLSRLIRRLDLLEIDYRKDRFLCSVVEAVILRELRLLKHKARIPVEQGATLFGVVDETGFLREGDIYIAFDKTDLIKTEYLSLDYCEMIVTRSPALHPGDIQLATNRIPPPGHSLRHLRNCIVFSHKGKRDLPSQLSGGDLDGDIYNVIWDQFAVKSCKRVFAPADYPLTEPRILNRQVQKQDMTAFFVEFMKTNNLGVIATRHMILADQRPAGTVDADCVKLAELHSTSVDYSKTGVPVSMDTLRAIKTNRFRPDFMAPAPPTHLQNRTEIVFDAPTRPAADEYNDEEDDSGPGLRYYLSEKILGQLYRAINEQKIWKESVRIDRKQGDGVEVWNKFQSYVMEQCEDKLGGVTWASFIDEAWVIREAYENAIAGACVDFSDHATISITELEVFTGNIFNKSGVQTRRQRDRSLQIKDEFDRIAAWIESLIRKQPIADLAAQGQQQSGGSEDDDDVSDINSSGESTWTTDVESTALELSIACLHVGCVKEKGSQRNLPRGGRNSAKADGKLSFKVLAACCVLKELNIAIRQAETRSATVVHVGGRIGFSGIF